MVAVNEIAKFSSLIDCAIANLLSSRLLPPRLAAVLLAEWLLVEAGLVEWRLAVE